MTISLPRHDMLTVVRNLGLSNGLQLCLDAGHEDSLPSGSTKWLDLSGNGYDFLRGTTTGADPTDPTINGTAGARSTGEYLSFDGGDYLLYDTSNETWMQNVHKDNAIYTFATWYYPGIAGAGARVWGTGDNADSTGFRAFTNPDDSWGFNVRSDAGGGVSVYALGGSVLNVAAWNFIAISVNEPGGQAVIVTNDNFAEDGSAAYSSPSASAFSTYTMQIGASGAAGQLSNGSRLASFCAWEGVALSLDQIRAMHLATRGKFGV